MTTVHADNPILDQGEIEEARGIFRRSRGTASLPSLPLGQRRLLFDADNTLLDTGGSQTAGERYWSSARRWVVVDIRSRTLDFDFPSLWNAAGHDFDVVVKCDVAIRDAPKIAMEQISSISDDLEPSIRRALLDCLMQIEMADGTADYAWFAGIRTKCSHLLATKLNAAILSRRGCFEATPLEVTVDFSASTRKHFETLQRLTQDRQIIQEQGKNREATTLSDLAVRDILRTGLSSHLSDPTLRMFEQVYANPTAENIAAAVTQAQERDHLQGDFIQEFLQRFVTDSRHLSPAELVQLFAGFRAELNSGPVADRVTTGAALPAEPSENFEPPSDDRW
jgi:hypothetical protein